MPGGQAVRISRSAILPVVLGLPEVGVESFAEVLEIAAVHLTTQKKYPQSYPHGPWGTFRLSPPLSVMR